MLHRCVFGPQLTYPSLIVSHFPPFSKSHLVFLQLPPDPATLLRTPGQAHHEDVLFGVSPGCTSERKAWWAQASVGMCSLGFSQACGGLSLTYYCTFMYRSLHFLLRGELWASSSHAQVCLAGSCPMGCFFKWCYSHRTSIMSSAKVWLAAAKVAIEIMGCGPCPEICTSMFTKRCTCHEICT